MYGLSEFMLDYKSTMKAFPISLREVNRPLKSPRREQCCCVVKDALTMYYKTVKLRDAQKSYRYASRMYSTVFFHYINSGFWQCQVELFVSRLWKDEGSIKNRNRKFRSIKCFTVNNWLWFYGNWIFRKRDFA